MCVDQPFISFSLSFPVARADPTRRASATTTPVPQPVPSPVLVVTEDPPDVFWIAPSGRRVGPPRYCEWAPAVSTAYYGNLRCLLPSCLLLDAAAAGHLADAE